LSKHDQKIVISRLDHEVKNGVHRVLANVNGNTVWFESAHLPLKASVEALASAYLLPAQAMGVPLEITGELDRVWRINARNLQDIYYDWYGYQPVEIVCQGDSDPSRGTGKDVTLFFSGGVDSFFTAQRKKGDFDNLLFVHGMDIPITSTGKVESYFPHVIDAARHYDARPALMSTNIQEDPTLQVLPWIDVVGGVMGAVAHVQEGVGFSILSASTTLNKAFPWGTHPVTDELYSTYNSRIEHCGILTDRFSKIREIHQLPVVQNNLRVCWDQVGDFRNCGECEKCLRTYTALVVLGSYDQYREVPPPEDLPGLFRKLPRLREYILKYWQEFDPAALPPDHRRALRYLLLRNGWRYSPFSKATRPLGKKLRDKTPRGITNTIRRLKGKPVL
jgi:hypothetical protein